MYVVYFVVDRSAVSTAHNHVLCVKNAHVMSEQCACIEAMKHSDIDYVMMNYMYILILRRLQLLYEMHCIIIEHEVCCQISLLLL